MNQKTQDRLLKSAMGAYDEEKKNKEEWEREARFWYGRALQAEFINEITPWLILGAMVLAVLVAIFWKV